LREEDEQKQWYKGTISAILNNQAYIGNLVQGKRRTRLFEGEKQRFTEKEEWIITENAHEPIVSVEVFDAVQEMITKKKNESTFSSQRLKSIPVKPNKYKGLLYCGHCGRTLRYFSFSVHGEVNRVYAFSCERSDGEEGTCSVYIRENVLDKLVLKSIGDVILEFNRDDDMDELFETAMKQSLQKYKTEERKLTGFINKEQQVQADAYEGYVLGKISQEIYFSTKEKSEEKRLQMQKKLDALEAGREKYLAGMQEKKQWLISLDKCRKGELNQDLLQSLLKEIRIYSKQRIEIHYRFHKKDFLEE
ncbi:MAG: recombinase family protein, partial [Eubacteriales bacterium]|nr:recombinase family protein [Eubacteriales bacterium]